MSDIKSSKIQDEEIDQQLEQLEECQQLEQHEDLQGRLEQHLEGENNLKSDVDEEIEEFDPSSYISPKSESVSRTPGQEGDLSLVNSDKNGKRFLLSGETMDKLKNPKYLQIKYSGQTIAFCQKFSDDGFSFPVKKVIGSKKGIIYAGKLVDEITDFFQLDFSNRTSMTFEKAQYKTNRGYPVAIIRIK